MTAQAGVLNAVFGIVAGVPYAESRRPVEQVRRRAEDSSMDEAGLAQIYERYSPAIFAHCRRMLGSAAAARDATQEAFVRVIAKGPKALLGEDALRYVYRVATNVCLNQIREQRVHDRATPAIVARSSSGGSGESGHADRQFAAALIEKCDDTGASIAVMFYIDEMSQVEIAKTLGITRRTVFNRLKKIEGLAHEMLGARGVAAKVEGEGIGT
jgi:RNA polymerase sigma-70 factor, ECF subfamily